MAQTNRHTYTQQTNIATSRLNQPKGQCSERKQFYLAGLRHINKDYNTPIPKGLFDGDRCTVWQRQRPCLVRQICCMKVQTDICFQGMAHRKMYLMTLKLLFHCTRSGKLQSYSKWKISLCCYVYKL